MRPSSSNMDGILLRLLLAFVQDVMNILYSRLQLEVKTTCNRLRSWTFLLRVIGPQLPKQRRFRHFQLPSTFPHKVHAVTTR